LIGILGFVLLIDSTNELIIRPAFGQLSRLVCFGGANLSWALVPITIVGPDRTTLRDIII
jgi:hypothetical protein